MEFTFTVIIPMQGCRFPISALYRDEALRLLAEMPGAILDGQVAAARRDGQ